MIYQLSQFFLFFFFFRETGERLATKEYQDFQRLSVNFLSLSELFRKFSKTSEDSRKYAMMFKLI